MCSSDLAKNPWVSSASPARLSSVATDEFRLATGYDAHTLSVDLEWMPAWDRTWSAITALRLPAGLHVHANWKARPGLPGRLSMSRRLAERLAGFYS